MFSHSLPPSDWNPIDLNDFWGGKDPTMPLAGFLTKTNLLKNFQIRLMASAGTMWTSQMWGQREDKCVHFPSSPDTSTPSLEVRDSTCPS